MVAFCYVLTCGTTQSVVHKPQTHSKETHTSQKVDKIPKGKSRKITVKAGDTPSGLAKKYGVCVEDVMKGAGITDPRKLIAGKTITVTNGGGSVSKTKQSKSTVTNTDKSQSSKKNGGSQPPPPPEPPKGPSGNGSGSRKPPREEEKKILKDGLKATSGAVLKYAEEHYPELVKKGEELLTEVEEAAAEAKDKVVEVIPEIVSEAKETVTNVVSESGKIIENISEISKKIDIQNLKLSDTVKNHIDRPYQNFVLLVDEITKAASPISDPQGTGALYWKVNGNFNGSEGLYELLIDPVTNSIWHFVFKSK
ncbi:MAG: LysM domain-containing protein [Clostridia bacterium]|nr:LysM domain-containing protein [Clostridia bacterium]